MVEGDARRDPLLAWALGAFHAALLLAALVLLAYDAGSIGGILEDTGTARGLVLGLGLWVVAAWTTRRALAGVPAAGSPRGGLKDAFGLGVLWAGLAGVLFLLVLAAVFLLPTHPGGGFRLRDLVGFGFFLAYGAAFAFVVGSFVGVALAAFDVLALRVADALLRVR